MMNYYVYRHIRPDTNQVFYIGIGNNNDKRFVPYARAKNKGNRRSDFWKRVVTKNNNAFEWEIIFECETLEECNAKETEFIKLYGRFNLGRGTLVNLTDGGSGAKNTVMSDEVKKKHSVSMVGGKHYAAKKVINVLTNEVFDTVSAAEKSLGLKKTLLGTYLRGQVTNSSPFLFLTYYQKVGKEAAMGLILQHKNTSMTNKKHSNISKELMSKSSINKGGRQVINTITNEVFPTASEVSRVFNINIYTLISKLNGGRTNNTNFKYA